MVVLIRYVPCLTCSVPVVVAVSPGHVAGEAGEHVEEAVGDQHVVVDAGDERYGEHGPANTCRHKTHSIKDPHIANHPEVCT